MSGQSDRAVQTSKSSINEGHFIHSNDFYSVAIPSDFADKTKSDITTFYGYANTSKTGDVLIKTVDIFSPCSPSLTGASTTTPLPNANGTAEWGRVDESRFGLYALEPEPICQPPIIYEDFCGEAGQYAGGDCAKSKPARLPVAAYALCSHKDGKTVVICISQMTQNEPLAKQIFDTFRWTK